MATTTLLQRHAGEGETIAEAIRDCLDYGKNPEKTESGKYISAYECDPATVADEFLLSVIRLASRICGLFTPLGIKCVSLP